MKSSILLVTATATFWGTIHEGAENIKANWVSTSQLAISYTVNGQAHGGYVVPSVTTSPQQIRNLLAIKTRTLRKKTA